MVGANFEAAARLGVVAERGFSSHGGSGANGVEFFGGPHPKMHG